MTSPRTSALVILLMGAAIGLSAMTAVAAGPSPLATHPGDVSVVQTLVHVGSNRAGRLRRIRDRIARPRSLPRRLAREVTSSLVMVAAAGELESTTFVVSVVVVNRSTAVADASGAPRGGDVESRFVRAAVANLIGVDVRRKRASVTSERAENLLSTHPSVAFCAAGLPASLVSALTSPVLHVAGAPIVPWLPGPVLRSALGLAFRACDQALPDLLLAEEVDRLADEFVGASGTTTSTLPEECDGRAQLEAKVVTDPPYPDCADFEWITPIGDCADDLAIELIDVATGRRLGDVLFGHSSQIPFFFGPSPVRLVLHVCNGEPGNPGGGTVTLYPIVSWG